MCGLLLNATSMHVHLDIVMASVGVLNSRLNSERMAARNDGLAGASSLFHMRANLLEEWRGGRRAVLKTCFSSEERRRERFRKTWKKKSRATEISIGWSGASRREHVTGTESRRRSVRRRARPRAPVQAKLRGRRRFPGDIPGHLLAPFPTGPGGVDVRSCSFCRCPQSSKRTDCLHVLFSAFIFLSGVVTHMGPGRGTPGCSVPHIRSTCCFFFTSL